MVQVIQLVAKIDFIKTTGEVLSTPGNILELEGTIEVKYTEASSSGKILAG